MCPAAYPALQWQVQEPGASRPEQGDMPETGTHLHMLPIAVATQKVLRVPSQGSWGMWWLNKFLNLLGLCCFS